MGFSLRPTITFISDETRIFPTASACSLTLRIPLTLVSYDMFKEKVTTAFLNTVGFGQV